MEPLAVDLVLLRAAAPDLPLVVGRILAARVVERHGRHGILNLAGAIVTAELPDEVAAGDRLRLAIEQTTPERVVLRLLESPPPLTAGPARAPEARLPGGGRVTVVDRDGDGGSDAHAEVVLRCELPALGPVELWIALDGERVRARVALRDGAPLTLGRAQTEVLRVALACAAGRAAQVAVVARQDPLDVYA